MARKHKASSDWTHVTFSASDDKPGKEYEIERRWDGALRCSCESFRFKRGKLGTPAKTCKHMLALSASGRVPDDPLIAKGTAVTFTVKRETTKRTVETFTFRRAISFGGLP